MTVKVYNTKTKEVAVCASENWAKCRDHSITKGWVLNPTNNAVVEFEDDDINYTIIDIYEAGKPSEGETRGSITEDVIRVDDPSKTPVTLEAYDWKNKFNASDKQGKILARLDSEELRYMGMDEIQATLTEIAFGKNFDRDKHLATYRTVGYNKDFRVYEVSYEEWR